MAKLGVKKIHDSVNTLIRGQIDSNVNTYLRPHTELRTRGSHDYRYRQDKATKDTYFYSFFQGLLAFRIAYPLKYLLRLTH